LGGSKVRIRPGRVLLGVGAVLISAVLAALMFFRVTFSGGALRSTRASTSANGWSACRHTSPG
jgi:hypothetical protein